MPRSVEDWVDRFERKPVKSTFQAVFLAVVLGVAVLAALWGFGVVSAPWKGAGDAYQEQQSAQNWVTAQRAFHQEQNDVIADQAKIASGKAALAEFKAQNPPPTDDPIAYEQWSQQESNYATAVTGPQQNCFTTVANYNTDAKSYLAKSWRDVGLPEQLDSSVCN